jgi:hypothetical protein
LSRIEQQIEELLNNLTASIDDETVKRQKTLSESST